MLDEVSVLGNKMFEHLNLSLPDIKAMPKVFGRISVILSGDLFQLPTVKKQQIFMKHKKGECPAFQGSLREDWTTILRIE